MLKTVVLISEALKSVTAICRAVMLKALFESLYRGSIYCLDCEFVPGFYSAYVE